MIRYVVRFHSEFRLCTLLDANNAQGGTAAGHRRQARREAEEARRRDSLPRRHRVFAAFLLTVGVFTDFEDRETLGLLLSGSIALLVGLIDDFGALTPTQKMLGQILAALVLIKSGTFIKLDISSGLCSPFR